MTPEWAAAWDLFWLPVMVMMTVGLIAGGRFAASRGWGRRVAVRRRLTAAGFGVAVTLSSAALGAAARREDAWEWAISTGLIWGALLWPSPLAGPRPAPRSAAVGPIRPFDDLSGAGLLWLINASTFHPRGWALAVVTDGDGKAVGWQLLGDGTEEWQFEPGAVREQFEAAQRTLQPRVERP